MKKNFNLIIYCLLFKSFSFGQNIKTDSLLNLIKSGNKDTSNLIHLFNLADEYETIGNYPEGISVSKKAIKLADEISASSARNIVVYQTAQKYKAKAHGNLGIIYRNTGDHSEALKNHFAALKIREGLNDRKGIASSYNNIGMVYDDQGNYPEALKFYLSSLKIKESIGDKKGIANSRNNIGNIYYAQGNYPEAIKNHLIALKLRKEIDDQKGMADSYNNIGNIYFAQASTEKDHVLRTVKQELALKNHIASLAISEILDDKSGIANSYVNIGAVYYDRALTERNPSLRENKLNEALKNFFISLEIRKSIGDKSGVSGSDANIGITYLKKKKYKDARKYIEEAIMSGKEAGHKESLREAYSSLTALDSTTGNYEGAYQNHKLFVLYRDSLDNEETRKKTIQNQMTYDFEKKEAVADAEHKKELENQQLLAEEKTRKQRVVLWFVIGSLLLVVIFSGFIFRSLKVTRKQKTIIEQQKDQVEKQKQEVEQQKQIVEEKQKEIIDSITYARRIQQSLLPTEKYIDRTLKRLHFRKTKS